MEPVCLPLARCKARPIVIERGSTIEHRIQEVEAFLQKKILNIRSNVQFGEGGAGAFSDGKLTTNLHSPYNDFILQEFFAHGADEDITYSATPHIGTDRLAEVVRNIRQEIMDLGGEFHFNTLFEDMQVQSDGSIAVRCSDNKTFTTQHLLLCLGHSARDTISMLYAKGLPMQAKAYSMGDMVGKSNWSSLAPKLNIKSNTSSCVFSGLQLGLSTLFITTKGFKCKSMAFCNTKRVLIFLIQ